MPPIDPRLPPATVRTTPASPRPEPLAPPVLAAPVLNTAAVSTFDRPVAPINTRGGVRDPSVGVRDGSVGVRDGSVGVRDGSVGVRDGSVGLRDGSVGVRDGSVGLRDGSVGLRDGSVGLRDGSVGLRDGSVGLRDGSVGLRDGSVGLRDGSVGLRDGSVGLRDGSVGIRDTSVGQLGPERTAYEKAVKSTLEKYLETPSYLRDDAPRGVRSDPKASVSSLPADLKAALQSTVARPESKSAKVVENVVHSSLWKGLSAAEKGSLAKVMSSAGEKGLVALGALLEGTPESVKSNDATGKSFLSNLADLASQPLNAALYSGTTKQKVLDDVLLEVANPDRVTQGDAPTCTVTSMEFELVRDDAAEYVRLIAGLTGPSGKVEMKGGGDLKLEPATLGQMSKRPGSQAIFQTAAMEYGNGGDDYDVAKGVSRDDKGVKDDYPGLLPYQQTVMLRQLFGVKYETKSLATESSRAKALNDLRNYVTAGKNRPVLLEIDQGNFNHAVTYEMQKNDRVYFRDPYGQIRSMPEAAFIKHVVAVHKPQVMPG